MSISLFWKTKRKYLSRPGYEIFCYLSDLAHHINVSKGEIRLRSLKIEFKQYHTQDFSAMEKC